MPTHFSPDSALPPAPPRPLPQRAPRLAAWVRARAREGCLLLLAALAATGCSDQTAPTAPEPGEAGSARPQRTTVIADMLIGSSTVFVSTGSSGFVKIRLALKNPGPKDTGLYLQGEVRQGTRTVSTDRAPIHCSKIDGSMPHGTCLMSIELVVPPTDLPEGYALFTLNLLKLQVDNTVTVLDSQAETNVSVVRI